VAKEIAAYGRIHTENSIREERIICGAALQVQVFNRPLANRAALGSRGWLQTLCISRRQKYAAKQKQA
jgi:hypothetical protein